MAPDDLVRVAIQPPNFMYPVLDEVGYISQVFDNHRAILNILNESGDSTMSGSILLEYLVPETSAKWRLAKAKHDVLLEEFAAKSLAIGKRLTEKQEQLSQKYGITKEAVHAIYSEMAPFFSNDY